MSVDIDRADELIEWYDEDTKSVEARPLFPEPSAPLDVARRLYAGYREQGYHTLVAWRGGWMRWHRTHWSEIDTAELRSHIYDVLGNAAYEAEVKVGGVMVPEIRPWNPGKNKVANVMEAMAAEGHISSSIDTPAWIGLHSAEQSPASQMISCTNGLLDLGQRLMIDHTPQLFNAVSVPFDYDPEAKVPTDWLAFLAAVWPDDPESVALLQEYLGYILSGRTDMQKLLMLIGPTRSGKGTIARMVTELVGRLNVAGPTLASLGTNFGLSPLLGKPLAIISDARLGDAPAHTVVERLLSITGEDMLTVDRKFRDPWTGKLSTRFVVLSNELPKFKDSSGAIANRLVILQMTESFLGREDRTLDDRLRAELPGILMWALDGLDRLTRNGRFTVPDSSREAANLMMDLASPVSAFVRDLCTRGPGATVDVDHLYDKWKTWAEENGHHAGAKSTFGRNLRAVVPSLKLSQPTINGVRARLYEGIALKSYGRNEELPVHPVHDASSSDDAMTLPVPLPVQPKTVQGTCTGCGRAETGEKPLVNGSCTGCTGKSALRQQHLAQTGKCWCGYPAPDGLPEHHDCRRQRLDRDDAATLGEVS